jgi:dephospho-CoA kinase
MDNSIKIIGIAGTDGSGKDTVGHILAEHGWLFVSVADFLREEARRRGLPLNREVLSGIGAEWRRQYGLGVLVNKAIDVYKASEKEYKGVVICAMRNAGEAEKLKELGGILVWVDADLSVRYERILKRGDQKSFRQFTREEEVDAVHGEDDTTLSTADVQQKVDIFIENNTNNLDNLRKTVEEKLKLT